jgi:predicted Zn-dependent peptidase
LGFNWTYLGRHQTVEQDMDAIKAVTVGDINSLIKDYPLSEFAQLSLGPSSGT